MAITSNSYTGNGSTTLYSFTFPYLDQSDVKVSLNGSPTTAYTFANATTIQFTTAPGAGVAIRIYRETDDSTLQAVFSPGSSIRASDLNSDFDQLLYLGQESSNTANSATTTSNTALTTANTALGTANTALSNSSTAVSTANSAVSTANAASSAAASAVSTANTASTNASNAVTTANAASSAASTAVSTANTALGTANSATGTANTALSTANTASTNASNAVSTANTASSNATTAVATANAATTTANNALSTANTALSNSNTAVTTANAAAAAVANAVLYTTVANVAAIPTTPSNNTAIEVTNSTGIESFSPLSGRPAGFVGSSGLSVRIIYQTSGSTWTWIQYFPNDPETRYLKLGGGTVTGNLEIGTTGSLTFEGSTADAFETTLAVVDPTADRTITLPNVTGTVVTTGDTGTVTNTMLAGSIDKAKVTGTAITAADTGTVTSTMILDGTIVDGDVNASAAIAHSKLANITAGSVLLGNATNVPTATALSGDVTVNSTGVTAIGTGVIVNADVNASAAIDGTKISPNFGSQNVVTTGTSSAAALIPTGSSVPTNGTYLPAANAVAIATNSTERLRIDSSGRVGIGTTGSLYKVQIEGSSSTVYSGSARNTLLGICNPDTTSGVYAGIELQVAGVGNASLANISAIDAGSGNTDLAFGLRNGGAFEEKARITSAGRLLVGTSSAASSGTYSAPALIRTQGNSSSATTWGAINIARGQAATAPILVEQDIGAVSFTDSAGYEFATIRCMADAQSGANDYPGRLVFSTTADGASSPTERMRLDNAGEVNIFAAAGRTVFGARSATGAGTTDRLIAGIHSATSTTLTGSISFQVFTNGNTQNTNNSYAGISDIKLKENIVDANSQWSDIKAIQVRNYNFKEETGQQTHTQIGLIAQEVEEVSPGLVFESPDRDAEGNDLGTVTKSVNYSVLYMKAVKALQEAMERIEVLEQRLTDAGVA